MEQLPLLASGSKATTTAPLYLTLDNTTSPSTSPPPSAVAPSPASEPSKHSNHERGTDTIKAKIMSHHLYPALLRAFIECQKVGAPPEVVGRLSALAGELESHSDDRSQEPSDPELDQFMETYCDVLMRYRQELIRPIQEADEFFRTMETQMDSFAIDDNSCEGGGSSEDEQETGDVAGLPEITSPCREDDKELKNHLLNKYSGYLSNLWRELSKKKKKSKLPRDARQKLLHWWQLHYRWPYPSVRTCAWFIHMKWRRRRWRSRRGSTRSRSTTGSSTSGSGTGSRRRRPWTTGCSPPTALRAALPPPSAWKGSTSPEGARIPVARDGGARD